MEQTALIPKYVRNALDRLQGVADDVRLVQGSARLKMNNKRTVLYMTFELQRPARCASVDEWLGKLASFVICESGYGEVEGILGSSGEVVGARVEVSYDLKSF